MKRRLAIAAGLSPLLTAWRGARAESGRYPNRLVKVIVPFAAGGTTDAMARKLGDALQARFGQTFIIESRPGAAGAIGAQAVLSAPADGHALLFTSTALVQAPLLTKKPAYDALRDFIPVAMTCTSPVVLGVSARLGTKTLREFIDYMRAHQGETSYASSGPGTTSNIYSEEMKRRFGFDSTHVPYSGDAKSTIDLVSNRVQFLMTTVTGLYPHAQQGSIRLLALTGTQRMPQIPEVPTFKEEGFDGFETTGWFGVFAAAKTPAGIVRQLREEVRKIAHGREYTSFLSEIKMMPPRDTEFADEVRKTQAAWAQLVKLNNITVE